MGQSCEVTQVAWQRPNVQVRLVAQSLLSKQSSEIAFLLLLEEHATSSRARTIAAGFAGLSSSFSIITDAPDPEGKGCGPFRTRKTSRSVHV
jgi:hypothetical protein